MPGPFLAIAVNNYYLLYEEYESQQRIFHISILS